MAPKHPIRILISLISFVILLIIVHFMLGRMGVFPDLEPVCDLPDGYEWIYKGEAEDFYTYHAISLESKSEIGIYFGNHPNAQETGTRTTAKDKLGRFDITWNIEDSVLSAPKSYYRYCLFNYRHRWQYRGLKIHIWVTSYAEEENEQLLKSLKKIKFRIRD